MNFNPLRQEVALGCSHTGALTLIDVPSSNFRIEVKISKSNWTGAAGIFWGVEPGRMDDGTQSLRFQTVLFRSFDLDGRQQFRIDRDLLEAWTPVGALLPTADRIHFLSAKVDAPDSLEIPLVLSIRDGFLDEVRWNGVRLDKLRDQLGVDWPRPLVSHGRLGIINEGGATVFRNAQIQSF
ncbi:MAG: hypothetical protein EXS05_18840 [Planctomycetaceae bacterium]|nr:hypothetical protein [Planctomycetaceae bacterium]